MAEPMEEAGSSPVAAEPGAAAAAGKGTTAYFCFTSAHRAAVKAELEAQAEGGKVRTATAWPPTAICPCGA